MATRGVGKERRTAISKQTRMVKPRPADDKKRKEEEEGGKEKETEKDKGGGGRKRKSGGSQSRAKMTTETEPRQRTSRRAPKGGRGANHARAWRADRFQVPIVEQLPYRNLSARFGLVPRLETLLITGHFSTKYANTTSIPV